MKALELNTYKSPVFLTLSSLKLKDRQHPVPSGEYPIALRSAN